MFNHPSRAAFGIAIAAALAALPACDKKKDSGTGGGPPGGYQGSKGGPPGVIPPGGGQLVEQGLPAPPGAGPHLTYNAQSAQSSKSNLLQIGLAFHNYFSAYNTLPAGISDSSGKPGLSWRVAILP